MDHEKAPASDHANRYREVSNGARLALCKFDDARLAYALALIETEARHADLVAALGRVDLAEAALAKIAPPGVLSRNLPAPAPFAVADHRAHAIK